MSGRGETLSSRFLLDITLLYKYFEMCKALLHRLILQVRPHTFSPELASDPRNHDIWIQHEPVYADVLDQSLPTFIE